MDWNLTTILSNLHPQICLIAKFRQKMKNIKFGTENTLFGYLWVRISKNIVLFESNTLKFASLENFAKKAAKIWDQKCLIWAFLSSNFKKSINIFEISTLEFF